MSSRLGQHLLRSKSKAENFGLFALYSSYFFYLLFDCPMANFWLLSSKQSHSLNVNHCIWAISFRPGAEMGGVRSLHLTEWPVSFDCKAITPQIAEDTLPDLNQVFPKCGNAPPQYPKQVQFDNEVAFRLAKYLIRCRIQGSKLQLFAHKSVT